MFVVASLYGKTGHLKQQSHMDEEAKRTKDNKEDLIIEIAADGAKKLKIFEYELCNLLISLNLPLQDVEPILEFTKKYTSRGSFVKTSKLNRHKLSDMIVDEIQPFLKQYLEEDLMKYPFSIMIDESSDVSKKNMLL